MKEFSVKKLVITLAIITVCFFVSMVIGGVLIGAGATETVIESGVLDEFEGIEDMDFSSIPKLIERYGNSLNISVNGCGGVNITGITASETPDMGTEAQAEIAEGGTVTLKGIICETEIIMTGDRTLKATYEGLVSPNLLGRDVVKIDNGTITVGGGVARFALNGKLTVYLPQNVSLKLDGTVGEVRFNDEIALKSMTLNGCIAEVDIMNVTADELKLKGCLGEVDISGSVKSVSVEGCLGEVDIFSAIAPTAPCEVKGNLGEIDITFPAGTALAFDRGGNMGEVETFGSVSGGIPFAISGNMGEVKVETER